MLIARKSDGTYSLNSEGQKSAYFFTVRKLIAHYMQNGLKMQPAAVNAKLGGLQGFVDQNMKSLDDYLDKLPQLAAFIGEPNSGRFGAFIGAHFISTLEKTETQLIERELPKAREKFENPYRTPGNEMLDAFGELFARAPALSYQEDGSLVSTGGSPPPAAAAATAAAVAAPVAKTIDKRSPGEIFLQQFAALFEKSPPLRWKEEDDDGPMMPSAGSPQAGQATSAAAGVPGNVTTSRSKQLPGEVLLQLFGNQFAVAPAYREPSESGQEVVQSAVVDLPQQVGFREFAQLSGTVTKYSKSGDNAGYQQWMGSLTSKQAAAVVISNSLAREQKGQPVDWATQMHSMSQKYSLDLPGLGKIREEVNTYRGLLMEIQKNMQKAAAASGNPAMIQKLYGQFVSIFENKDTISAKKTALKMTLLQIPHPQAKGILETGLSSLIDSLKNLYHLD